MPLPIFVVDAFTSEAFAGNPAAVVLGHGDDAWMQQLAAEMKHSETCYLRPRADGSYDLRWFTPEVEVDLCGHATLASAHVLYETDGLDQVTFHTRSGALHATHAPDGSVTLDFPLITPEPAPAHRKLFAALGIDPVDFLRIEGDWYLCVVEHAKAVRDLDPDFGALRELREIRGIYVSAAGDAPHDITSRCFGPSVGIDEDPVTGSMHCVLAAYWCPRLGTDELRARQASPRGGELRVRRSGDRALITGHAVTVLRGEISA
jgi:PhzF family phenazine biosynthesis protein